MQDKQNWPLLYHNKAQKISVILEIYSREGFHVELDKTETFIINDEKR